MILTRDQVRERLRHYIIEHFPPARGAMTRAAVRWGVDTRHLSEVLSGKRSPPNSIIQHIGIRRVNHFEEDHTK